MFQYSDREKSGIKGSGWRVELTGVGDFLKQVQGSDMKVVLGADERSWSPRLLQPDNYRGLGWLPVLGGSGPLFLKDMNVGSHN